MFVSGAGVGDDHRKWLRRYRRVGDARIRLICLPHAGGAASYFRRWPALFPDDIDVASVQYPGRQDRISEEPLRSMEEMASGLAGALISLADKPLILFGHSMGSAIAYEVSRTLETRWGVSPERVFVSGREAPHLAVHTDLHRQGDEAILKSICELGGLDPAVLKDKDLLDMVMLAIRADYALIENYRPKALPRISAPLMVLFGDSDEDVDFASSEGWRQLTQKFLGVQCFPGGHFYLESCLSKLADTIMNSV